ncbi:MAG: IgA Peptidase M64 [Bacteroidales bacterium]|nr:IgA Peptidase M64 [Bacteroidales bacterium]
MKRIFLAALSAFLLAACAVSPAEGDGTASSLSPEAPDYDAFFTGERLRLDFVLAGNNLEQYAFLDGLHKECSWAGSPNSLIDTFGYGQYFFEAFAGDTLVYSHGFSTLFEEWRTTEEAGRRDMAEYQTVWMPFPKQPINVVLYQRIRSTGRFEKIFETAIDPSDRHISPGPENDFKVKVLQESGDPAHKVDLVFAGEGYTKLELLKLRRDAKEMMEYLFSMEPYSSRRDDFNVFLVESVSEDSGVDIPQDGEWRNTVMDSGFDTFYEDRYLTIQDHKKIASVYSGVPFDALFIIANESKYGGGGIYNSYAMGSSDHRLSLPVFIHEFGHSFAGLGDEYYDSSVAYDDEYYPAGIEPWEPNITNLTDFGSKWADMVDESTPVPTPNDPDSWYGVVGVFEGAGYMTHGCYRPYYECRMLNNTAPCFCPVCQRAISRMIDFYVR